MNITANIQSKNGRYPEKEASASGAMFSDAMPDKNIYVESPVYDDGFGTGGKNHIARYSTLGFVVDGKGYFDGVCLKKGDAFFIRQDRIGKFYPDSDDPWHCVRISFGGSFADMMLKNAGFGDRSCSFRCRSYGKIVDRMLACLNADYGGSCVTMHLIALLVDVFAYLTDDKPDMFFERTKTGAEKRVERGLEFIRANYKDKNCVASLAKSEGVTERYLSRIFSVYSEYSPQRYLINVRIEKAESMLRSTSEPVGSVAKSVGYEDAMQFSKIFKKYTGLSPVNYRKSL